MPQDVQMLYLPCSLLLPSTLENLVWVLQVLILGWAQPSFMTMLLQELDHGPAALPKGSEVTLFNNRESPDVMGEHASMSAGSSARILQPAA